MAQYKKTSTIPVSRNALIRPRIDALFEDGMQLPAVAVTAETGFGKTQAVASFLERSAYRGVWQQLTLLDNLPLRFWESFVYTVSLHRPTLAHKLAELGFPSSLHDFHRFLQLITEDLYADDSLVVFVFDDFHLIDEESILRFFEYFLSANLENICLVFITKKTSLHFPHEKIFTVTTDDLRFTKDEIKLYFEAQNAHIKNDAELNDIYAYTSGWPIALNLIGLSSPQKYPSVQERLLDSRQALFDLIEKEIFSGYTFEEQVFFILLSFLNFFPQELVLNIGTPIKKSVALLLQSNIFVSYDQRAKVYYLHNIFMEFLSEKQFLIEDVQKHRMLNFAGDWCLANKFFADAVFYYNCSGETGKIATVIQGFKGMPQSRRDADLYMQYIESFSDKFMQKYPLCGIVYAMLLLNNLRLKEAKTQINLIQKRLAQREDTAENRLMQGEAFISAGLISMGLGTADYVGLFHKATELLPNGSSHWNKSLQLVKYGNALNLTSEKEGSVEKSLEALFSGMPYATKVLNGVGYGVEYLAAAEAAFLKGNFKDAQIHAYRALYMAEEETEYDVADNALFLLLRIFLLTGAVKNIEDILQLLEKKDDTLAIRRIPDIALGWFYSEVGEPQEMPGDDAYGRENNRPPISIDKDALLQIRCLIEKKDYAKALALTTTVEKIFRKRNLIISLIYLFVYRAALYYNMDDTEQSAKALTSAYDLAFANGLVVPFIEFGHKTRSMLRYFSENPPHGIPAEWLSLVYVKASTYAKRHAYIVSHFKQINKAASHNYSLTYKEIEILRNMGQGLTRNEIADSMYISPHTVKSTLKTIYTKMEAVNGADAVRIASNAGLI